MTPKTLIVGSVCAIVGVVLILFATRFFWSNSQRDLPTPPKSEPSPAVVKPAEPIVARPIALAASDIPTIKRAMADCDMEAAKNPDGLYFLVTPLAPATLEAATSLAPPAADNYGSFSLVPSQAMFSGIEGDSLKFTKSQIEFSIIDMQTTQIKQWGSAMMGPSMFTYPNADGFSKFQIGFDFGDKSVKWTSEYDRQKGNCYWVNVRLKIQPSLPPYGRRNYGPPKSFPTPARTLRCANRACEVDADP
jgi:hypothetical protein